MSFTIDFTVVVEPGSVTDQATIQQTITTAVQNSANVEPPFTVTSVTPIPQEAPSA